MNNGPTGSIRILASDDTGRTVTLTETKATLFGTDDSQWVVYYDDGRPSEWAEWLRFRATDGTERMVRIACTKRGGAIDNNPATVIDCKFVHAAADGSDEIPEDQIFFVDPDNYENYRVVIPQVSYPPRSPIFVVDHPFG